MIYSNPSETSVKSKRYLSIDVFKGMVIIVMIFVNSLALFENVPSWSKHAVDYGLTYVDFIAPIFLFMMALNFVISYNKRIERDNKKDVYFHYLKRFLILLGIGLLLGIRPTEHSVEIHWGTLQVLGFSGLILLPFIHLKIIYRVILGVFMIFIHQILLYTFIGQIIFDAIEGGILGSLSWGAMIILSSVIAEGFVQKEFKKYFIGGGTLCVVIGISSFFVWGFSRFRITLPFVFLTIGAAALLYYVFYLIFDEFEFKYRFFNNHNNFLSILGQNSLIIFILHILIISIAYEVIPLDIDFQYVLMIAGSNIMLNWLVALMMNKAGMMIKL